PYAAGAAVAWSGPDVATDALDRGFAAQVFSCPPGDPAVATVHRLGRAVSAPTLGAPNRSNAALALFDEPLAGRLVETVDPVALEELRAAALEALAAWSRLPVADVRRDYTFVARLVLFAAEKLRASQRIRQELRALGGMPGTDRAQALARLDRALAVLGEQRARLAALAAEFEAVWLRHARRSEIQQTLDRFAALDRRYAAALAWLAEQRQRVASGQPLDAEFQSYDTAGYRALWEEGLAELLRLAELVGVDELPPDVRGFLAQADLTDQGAAS
ncbi:MAG: beta-N-acetylhexosaminidase, partial [Thermomicrobium sp.]|nr:beta-N-acetylhexosaminidase [Thermomicrobium sp.]